MEKIKSLEIDYKALQEKRLQDVSILLELTSEFNIAFFQYCTVYFLF